MSIDIQGCLPAGLRFLSTQPRSLLDTKLVDEYERLSVTHVQPSDFDPCSKESNEQAVMGLMFRTFRRAEGFEVEHLVLSVHGMTCTGCEKKLYRSLDSLPAISNIKTSLVLAQAEFDLTGSTAVDSVNIIKTIEKMTGFTCTKITQSGEELDMIVGGNVQDFAHEEDLPLGVADLTVLSKNTIRVIYHPKIVGARDLLSSPFFRLAKLAPIVARPLVALGRAYVHMTFFMTLLSTLLTILVLILA
jgi:Cu2+-exporting ATPase